MLRRGAALLPLLVLCAVAAGATAQTARVDALAVLLAAEDARAWDSTVFVRALASRDSLVRRARPPGRVVAGAGPRGLGRIAQGDTIVAIRRTH